MFFSSCPSGQVGFRLFVGKGEGEPLGRRRRGVTPHHVWGGGGGCGSTEWGRRGSGALSLEWFGGEIPLGMGKEEKGALLGAHEVRLGSAWG